MSGWIPPKYGNSEQLAKRENKQLNRQHRPIRDGEKQCKCNEDDVLRKPSKELEKES
jgi:hypothetical protein